MFLEDKISCLLEDKISCFWNIKMSCFFEDKIDVKFMTKCLPISKRWEMMKRERYDFNDVINYDILTNHEITNFHKYDVMIL